LRLLWEGDAELLFIPTQAVMQRIVADAKFYRCLSGAQLKKSLCCFLEVGVRDGLLQITRASGF